MAEGGKEISGQVRDTTESTFLQGTGGTHSPTWAVGAMLPRAVLAPRRDVESWKRAEHVTTAGQLIQGFLIKPCHGSHIPHSYPSEQAVCRGSLPSRAQKLLHHGKAIRRMTSS